MNDKEFINILIDSYFSLDNYPDLASLNNTINHRLTVISDKLDKFSLVTSALKNGIYAKNQLNEDKLNYIQAIALSNVENEWYLSNHCDFCVNIRDYKELFWLKEDKSE